MTPITIQFERENIDVSGEDVYYTKHSEVYTIASVAFARLAVLKATPWIEVLSVSAAQEPIIVCE